MAHHLKLPALGALAVAAAAFGLHLGESAISNINPLFFQGPAVHPRDRGAAIDDVPQPPIRSEFALAYGWDQGANARAQDCAGCGPGVSAGHYAPSEPTYRTEADLAFSAPEAPAPVERQAEERRPDAFASEYAAVDRYAHYEIEAPAAEEAPAEDAEHTAYEE